MECVDGRRIRRDGKEIESLIGFRKLRHGARMGDPKLGPNNWLVGDRSYRWLSIRKTLIVELLIRRIHVQAPLRLVRFEGF
jgi:hypothetical protein